MVTDQLPNYPSYTWYPRDQVPKLKSRQDFWECRRSGRASSNLWNLACKCTPQHQPGMQPSPSSGYFGLRLEALALWYIGYIDVKLEAFACGVWLLSNLPEVEVAGAFLQMTKWAELEHLQKRFDYQLASLKSGSCGIVRWIIVFITCSNSLGHL